LLDFCARGILKYEYGRENGLQQEKGGYLLAMGMEHRKNGVRYQIVPQKTTDSSNPVQPATTTKIQQPFREIGVWGTEWQCLLTFPF